jgi:PAS domain S-box-containing protein
VWQDFLDVLDEPVIVFDRNGLAIGASRAALGIIGYPSQFNSTVYADVIARINLRDAAGRPLAGDELPSNRALRGETVDGQTLRLTWLDGRELVIQASARPLMRDGRVDGAVLSWRLEADAARIDQALNEKEARIDAALRAADAGIWEWEIGTGAHRWSRGMFELLGVPASAGASLDTWRAALHPDDREQAEASILESVDRRLPLSAEYRIVRANGALRWVSALGQTSYDSGGRPLRMVGVCIDVTERKRFEEALRASEERFVKAFHNSPDAININRLRDGLYVEVNTGFLSKMEYERSEVIGRSSLDLNIWADPADRERLVRGLQEHGEVANLEARFRTKSGRDVVALMSASVITLAGEPHILSVTRDITERKRAEAEIRRLNRLYAALSEINQALVRVSSREELFDEICRALVTAGGFRTAWVGAVEPGNPQVRVVASHGADTGYLNGIRVFADDRPEGRGPTGTAIREGREQICNDVLNDPRTLPWRRDGRRFDWGASAAFPIRLGGRTFGALTVFAPEAGFFGDHEIALLERAASDVSFGLDSLQREADRRFADASLRESQAQLAQAQKLESIGRLAGGVAHDFNNMLGVIAGHAELALLDMAPSNPLHAELEAILSAARRSADLTRQLLAFARKQTVSPRVLDLNVTVTGMLRMLQRLIGEDVDLRWTPGSDLWLVEIDPSQVDQILANLAVNARDAMAGTGTLAITLENVSLDEAFCRVHVGFLPGDYVRLEVSDTGAGMSPEVLAHAFEPFFTTKDATRGTGLGLATVYGIVTQNHGFIEADSQPGRGTTLRVWLPRHLPTGEPEQSVLHAAAADRPGGSETVLLVEDADALRQVGESMLSMLGYTVLTAASPAEAIRTTTEHARDIRLVVTDVILPQMNGRELADRLKAIVPGVRCLFMSGYTADVMAHHGGAGSVHFVQKPFSIAALARAVREALES